MKYSIKDQFEAAVSVIQNLPKNGTFQPSTSLMLLFYSYYKQARNGECKSSRPAFYDPVGQSKWEAWKGLGSMSSEQAMQLYVAELKKIAEIMPQSKEVENFIEKIGGIYEMVDEEEEEENGKIDYNSENNAKQCNDTNGNKDDSKGEDGGRSVVPIKKESKVVNEESSLKSSKESHKRGKSNTRRNNSKKKNRAYNVNYGSFNSKNRGIFEELDKELDKELVKRQFDADYDNDGLIFKEKAFDQNKRKEYFSNDVNEGDKVIVNDNEVDTKNEGAMNNSDNIITNTKITTDNIVKTIDKNDTNDNETSINNEKTAISSLIDLHSDRVLSDCYSSNDEFLDTFEFLDSQLPVNIKYLSETNCASKCMGNGLSLEASSFEHNNDRKTKDNDKDGDFNDSSDKGLHKNNEKSRGFGIQKQAADLDSILFMPQNGDLKQQNNDIKQQEDSVKIISEPSTSSSSSYIKSKRKNKSFLNYQTKTKIDRQNSHEDNKALSTCENLNTVNGRNSSQSRNNDEIKEILLILQSSLTQLRKDVKELHTSVKDFQDVKSLIPSLPTTIFIIVWPIIISMAFRYMSSRR